MHTSYCHSVCGLQAMGNNDRKYSFLPYPQAVLYFWQKLTPSSMQDLCIFHARRTFVLLVPDEILDSALRRILHHKPQQ